MEEIDAGVIWQIPSFFMMDTFFVSCWCTPLACSICTIVDEVKAADLYTSSFTCPFCKAGYFMLQPKKEREYKKLRQCIRKTRAVLVDDIPTVFEKVEVTGMKLNQLHELSQILVLLGVKHKSRVKDKQHLRDLYDFYEETFCTETTLNMVKIVLICGEGVCMTKNSGSDLLLLYLDNETQKGHERISKWDSWTSKIVSAIWKGFMLRRMPLRDLKPAFETREEPDNCRNKHSNMVFHSIRNTCLRREMSFRDLKYALVQRLQYLVIDDVSEDTNYMNYKTKYCVVCDNSELFTDGQQIKIHHIDDESFEKKIQWIHSQLSISLTHQALRNFTMDLLQSKLIKETREEPANCRNNHLNMVPRLMKTCQHVKSESFRDLKYTLADVILRLQNMPMSSQQRETDISLQWAMHEIMSEDMDDETSFTEITEEPDNFMNKHIEVSFPILKYKLADDIRIKQIWCMFVGERDPFVAKTQTGLRSENINDTNDRTSFTDRIVLPILWKNNDCSTIIANVWDMLNADLKFFCDKPRLIGPQDDLLKRLYENRPQKMEKEVTLLEKVASESLKAWPRYMYIISSQKNEESFCSSFYCDPIVVRYVTCNKELFSSLTTGSRPSFLPTDIRQIVQKDDEKILMGLTYYVDPNELSEMLNSNGNSHADNFKTSCVKRVIIFDKKEEMSDKITIVIAYLSGFKSRFYITNTIILDHESQGSCLEEENVSPVYISAVQTYSGVKTFNTCINKNSIGLQRIQTYGLNQSAKRTALKGPETNYRLTEKNTSFSNSPPMACCLGKKGLYMEWFLMRNSFPQCWRLIGDMFKEGNVFFLAMCLLVVLICYFFLMLVRTFMEDQHIVTNNGKQLAICYYPMNKIGSERQNSTSVETPVEKENAISASKDQNLTGDLLKQSLEKEPKFLSLEISNFTQGCVTVETKKIHKEADDLDFEEDVERKDEVDTTTCEWSDSDDYFLNQKGRINDDNEESDKILPSPAELQDISATLDLQEPDLVNNDNDEKLVADKQINTELDIFLADTVAENTVDTTAGNGKEFQNDLIENDMEKRKSPRVKWYSRQFDILQDFVETSFIFPLKRKHLSEDVKSNKRTRLQGIVARQSDFDVEVNEVLYALSLRQKTHINTNMVYFLLDLIHLPRKWSTKKMIEASCYLVTEDEALKVKEVFLSLECYETEASKPVHKDIDPYFIASLSGDNSDYEIPGIDYELQFLKSKPRDKESEIPKQNKSGHANCSIEGFTLQVKLKDSFQGEADDENNIATWLQSAIPSLDEEAAVNTGKSRGTSKQVAKVQMQVTPPAFHSQSDVAPLSRSNLQDALTFAEGSEDKEFQNLANKKNASIFFEELKDEFSIGNGDVPSERNKKALLKEIIRNLPQPQIDTSLLKNYVFHTFDPIMVIIDQIANGTPPTPHISMRYELLRFCTLRSYPKENKPFIIKLAEAGFYYASDGDGVVCYCCGIRRYNWVEEDIPMKIHKRVNPNCKFLKKNEEVNVPVQYFGPYRKALMAIMDIPEPVEREDRSEDVNNDWAPERVRSPAVSQPNRRSESAANSLGINTATPKHTQYATKTARVGSYSGWPDTASHTPEVLADAGFFYAGFGDCVRCFYCGIGLRHWTKEDDPFVEHARWSRNCVFVKQKKGEEFVNLVQMAAQYSQENENETQSSSPAGNQLPAQEVERLLLSDAAQSVLEMGYQPRIIKRAIEQILCQNGNEKITAQTLMERVLEIEEADERAQASSAQSVEGASAQATAKPLTAKPSAAKGEGSKSDKDKANDKDKKSSNDNKDKKEDKTSSPSNGLSSEAASQDPKEIKKENEELKEQTLCKVCLDNTVCIVFLPCGHLVTCADCAPAMRKCPICRAVVKGTVRTYMS